MIGILLTICFLRRRRRRQQKQASPPDAHVPFSSASAFDLLSEETEGHGRQDMREVRPARADMGGLGGGSTDGGTTTNVRSMSSGTTPQTTIRSAPGSRLRLHDSSTSGWQSTAKDGLSNASSPLSESPTDGNQTNSPFNDPPQPTRRPVEPQSLEQRAEQLSPPELERLAALVARRLERVRGAPPQYQATESVGV